VVAQGEPLVEKISPERLYQGKERLQRLNTAVEGLTDQQRDILVRSRMMGQTYQEISDAMGLSVATVFRHLKAVMAILSQEVDAKDDENELAVGESR